MGLNVLQNDPPWYANGLRFECTGCGKCCTGAPGFVWVDEEEIQQIADYLNLSIDDFTRLYLRQADGRMSLIELPVTYDCIFLEGTKCTIYPVRPTQCRTYPWWPRNLKSEKDWQTEALYCEGISETAPLIDGDTIEEQRLLQVKTNEKAHGNGP